jgi:hypothetical protein
MDEGKDEDDEERGTMIETTTTKTSETKMSETTRTRTGEMRRRRSETSRRTGRNTTPTIQTQGRRFEHDGCRLHPDPTRTQR